MATNLKGIIMRLDGNPQKAQELIEQHANEHEVIPAEQTSTNEAKPKAPAKQIDGAQMMRDALRL